MPEKISRRDFLKLAGIAAAVFGAGCGPLSQEEQPGIKDGVTYKHNPFYYPGSIEADIASGLIESTEFGERGVNGQPLKRMLVADEFRRNDFLPLGSGFDGDALKKVDNIQSALKEVGKIVLFQERKNENSEWEVLPVPGSLDRQNIFRSKFEHLDELNAGMGDIDRFVAKAKLNATMHPEQTSDDEMLNVVYELFVNKGLTEEETSKLVGDIMIIRHFATSIPEDATPEVMELLHTTALFHYDKETQEVLRDYSNNSGLLRHALFVPKNVPDHFKMAMESWKERFVPLEGKPQVWLTKVYNMETKVDEYELIAKHRDEKGQFSADSPHGPFATLWDSEFQELLKDGNLTPINTGSTDGLEVRDFFYDGLFDLHPPTEIYLVNPDILKAFMVPNKLVGKGKARIAWGVKMSKRVHLTSSTFQDLFLQLQLTAKSYETWLTEVTDNVSGLFERGVRKIDKWGGFSPLDSMKRNAQGMNDVYGIHQSLIPESDVMKGVLLEMLYQIIMSDMYDKQTNMGVIMKDVHPQYLEAREVATWIKNFGIDFRDTFNLKQIPPVFTSTHTLSPMYEMDGTNVTLHQGEAIPLGGIIEIDGIFYVTLAKPKRDEDGFALTKKLIAGGLSQIANDLNNRFVDNINGAIVIPLSEAEKTIMPLDMDDNILDALKIATYSGFLALIIFNPSLATSLTGGAYFFASKKAHDVFLNSLYEALGYIF